MAKRKAAAQKTRGTTRKKASLPASVEKRSSRDVLQPSVKRIEESFKKGTTQTLDSFRSSINWE